MYKKIELLGLGAVGGFIGALLHSAGLEVNFFSRGETLKKQLTHGLKLESFQFGILEYKDIKIFDSTDIAKQFPNYFDLILVCVKSHHTEEVAKQITSCLNQNGVVLSLQNGLENEEILAKYIPKEKVIGGVIYIGSQLLDGYIVKHTSGGRVEFGKYFEETNPEILEKLYNTLKSAQFKTELSENIKKRMWTKIIWNAAFNPLSVIIEAVVMDMIKSENCREILTKAMREVIQVAAAEGIEIPETIIDSNLQPQTNLGEFKTSMLQDFERKNKMEHYYINGAIIRFGKKHNIPTPINEMLYNLVEYKYQKFIALTI